MLSAVTLHKDEDQPHIYHLMIVKNVDVFHFKVIESETKTDIFAVCIRVWSTGRMSDKFAVSKEASSVACDICVGVKTPALKTCLKCEVSMCAEHLQTHLTSPVLKTHPLTKPVSLASSGQEVSRCSAHGKLVEYYCLDDRVLVCMSCAIEEGHRLHNMKTLQNAHKELTDNLRVKMKTLDKRQKESKGLESWYTVQRQGLENSVGQLIKTGSALRDLVLASVESSVYARLGALQTAQQAVSSALKEDDEFIFLQKFAGVHKALEEACMMDLRRGLESEMDRDNLIKEIRKHGQKIEEQVLRLVNQFLAFVDPENQQNPQDKGIPFSELTFDSKTLGPGMTLSEDLKTVFYSPASTNLTELNRLFRTIQQTQKYLTSHGNQSSIASQLAELSRALKQTHMSIDVQLHQPHSTLYYRQGLTASHQMQTIRCLQRNTTDLRWIVWLSDHFDWTIGICDENTTRGDYATVYGLKIKNEQLSSLQTEYRKNTEFMGKIKYYTAECQVLRKFHVTYPWKVEVIWDCTTQLLSFYSRSKPTNGFLLLKLKSEYMGHGLYPFITMEPKMCNPQNSAYRNQLIREQNVNNDNSYTRILCVLCNK